MVRCSPGLMVEEKISSYRLMVYFLMVNLAGLAVAGVLAVVSGPVAAVTGFIAAVALMLYVFYVVTSEDHEARDHQPGDTDHRGEHHLIVPVD